MDSTQLALIYVWLPVMLPIALGLLFAGIAGRYKNGIQRVLIRRGLRMAGVLLVVYGLILAITRLVALDLTTLSRTVGQLLIIGLGAYILWEGLELVLNVIDSKLDERTGDPDARARVDTLVTLARWTGGVVIVIVSLTMALSALNINVAPLIASAGIAGLAISLGAQKVVKDLIAGVLIIVEDQYRVGDVIDIAGKTGVVEHISLRATHLRDINGTLHIVSHSDVTTVSNLTSSWARAVVDVGVGYSSDIDHVIQTLERVGEELMQDEETRHFFIEKPTVAGPEALGDSSIVVRLMARVPPGKQWDAQRIIRRHVKTAFDAGGIEMPFPQYDLHIRTDETKQANLHDRPDSATENDAHVTS